MDYMDALRKHFCYFLRNFKSFLRAIRVQKSFYAVIGHTPPKKDALAAVPSGGLCENPVLGIAARAKVSDQLHLSGLK